MKFFSLPALPWNDICLICHPSYFLYNGLCYSRAGCLSYNLWYGCYSCKQGYSLTDRQCIRGQYVPNCLLYNDQTGVCRQCWPNYYLIGNLCWRLPSNCVRTNNQGQCVECNSPFTPINGQCARQIPPNCYSYNPTNNICSKCEIGFQLSNNLCTSCPQGFSSDGISCSPTYCQ